MKRIPKVSDFQMRQGKERQQLERKLNDFNRNPEQVLQKCKYRLDEEVTEVDTNHTKKIEEITEALVKDNGTWEEIQFEKAMIEQSTAELEKKLGWNPLEVEAKALAKKPLTQHSQRTTELDATESADIKEEEFVVEEKGQNQPSPRTPKKILYHRRRHFGRSVEGCGFTEDVSTRISVQRRCRSSSPCPQFCTLLEG